MQAKKEEEVVVPSDYNEEDAAAATSATDDVLLDGTVAKQPTPAYNKGLIDFQVFQASNYEKVRTYVHTLSLLYPKGEQRDFITTCILSFGYLRRGVNKILRMHMLSPLLSLLIVFLLLAT